MLSKKEVKDIQSLSQKKFRKAANLFVAEGPKIVGELLQLVPERIRAVYATAQWIGAQDNLRSPVVEVSEAELERISGLQTPNGVLAVVAQEQGRRPEATGFLLYLDGIQDPGNFGTIVRTADWFGVSHIVCSEGSAELYNPKVVQATMASVARVNVYYDEGGWLSQVSVPVIAATLNGTPLGDHPKLADAVLVIGNESRGVSGEVLRYATSSVTIPRQGAAESLNAAVAAGILMMGLKG